MSKFVASVPRRTFVQAGLALGASQVIGAPFIINALGEEPVKIGMVNPLTGVLSALAQSEVDGAKYAVGRDQQEGRHSRPPSRNSLSRTRPTTSAPACRRRKS